MAYEIRAGVPLPTAPSTATKYRFGDMAEGEMIFVPANEAGPNGHRLRSAASHYARRYDKSFTVRQMDGGYGCWRVS